MHVRVVKARQHDPPAQIDHFRRGKRHLVDADPAGNALTRDREGALRRQLRVHRADQAVFEDQSATECTHVRSVTIRVTDFEASMRFYSTVLAPLGASLGFYDDQKQIAEWGDFSIAADGKPVAQNVHVAFAARDNAAVDAFWQGGNRRGLCRQRGAGRTAGVPHRLRRGLPRRSGRQQHRSRLPQPSRLRACRTTR